MSPPTRARPPLPAEFLTRMEDVLGDEMGAFRRALDDPRARGLRLNPARTTPAELASLLPVELTPAPTSELGFLVPEDSALGGHLAHRVGLFYLQDPSAMAPVEIMDPQPGWRVVDVAAAPGGKTTHLLSLVGEEGLVVANDVSGSRLRALHENLERWAAAGVVTCRTRVDELARRAAGTFDAALLDAPCSGEGLFRREPEAILQWSPALVRGSARRQARLLDETAELVRPGGRMVYSTCTFEPEENEVQVAAFLQRHPEWELCEVAPPPGGRPGLPTPGWPTERTVRLWPHHGAGDGQFVAAFRHRGRGLPAPAPTTGPRRPRQRHDAAVERDARQQWHHFQREACPGLDLDEGRIVVRGPQLWYRPAAATEADVERSPRPGLPLGVARPGRFQPAQALAAFLDPALAGESLACSEDDPLLTRFLRGEEIESSGPDGWVLVCYRRWGLGWGRRRQGVLKNHLPHGLRVSGG